MLGLELVDAIVNLWYDMAGWDCNQQQQREYDNYLHDDKKAFKQLN